MPTKKHLGFSSDKILAKAAFLRRFMWLERNFAYCLGMSALIWIVCVCYYVEHYLGWNTVLSSSPADFGIFLLSTTLPLLFLWFVLAYIERSSSLDANANLFALYINSLLYPDDDASEHAKAFAKVLQEQIGLLQKSNHNVVEQSVKLKKDLEVNVNDLSKLLEMLDSYSTKTMMQLNEGVKHLADRCTYITDKTTNSVTNLHECTADIAQNADKFLGSINPVLDEISAVSANIKNNIADNKLNLAELKKQLDASADISRKHISEMLVQSTEDTKRIEQAFYRITEEYDTAYRHFDTGISSIEGRIDEQKRLIGTQTKVLDHNTELLNGKLNKYGKIISAEIEKLVKASVELERFTKKQISALKTVNSETNKTLQGIGGTFDAKRMELERCCEDAVNTVQDVVIAINNETDKLISFTNMTQTKNNDLQNITKTVVDKIGDISSKLALQTDALKDKAVEVIDKFTEADELLSRNADKINISSGILLNSSKEGLKLWEENNAYINTAAAGIVSLKEKLSGLRDDIKVSAQEIEQMLEGYEQRIQKYEKIKSNSLSQLQADFDLNSLEEAGKSIQKTLFSLGINTEKLYTQTDMFDLWESYLSGHNSAFTDKLTTRLSKKQITAIRKAFDDNLEFHNLVIGYLFKMDSFIKHLFNTETRIQNEAVNFTVHSATDKIYFVLIKALNNAE